MRFHVGHVVRARGRSRDHPFSKPSFHADPFYMCIHSLLLLYTDSCYSLLSLGLDGNYQVWMAMLNRFQVISALLWGPKELFSIDGGNERYFCTTVDALNGSVFYSLVF